MKSITKTVTTTYTPEWIKHDFLVYGPDFRRVRERMKRKYNKCFACNHPFDDGETISIGGFGKHGNKALCQTCAIDMDDGQEE